MDKRKGPLAAMKAGDEAAWRRLDGRWVVVRLVDVTPTGQMTASDGTAWLPDGRQRGYVGFHAAPTIEPLTEALRTRVAATNASMDRAFEIRETAREIYRLTSGALRTSVTTPGTVEALRRALSALKGDT